MLKLDGEPATAQRAVAGLRPYLSRLQIGWLAEDPEQRHRSVEGSIAFVDISGFTRLSERLARKGKVGAEELTEAIGTCFSRLLGTAYANGGGLLKFGGDALLLLFQGAGHEAKACRAAAGMRRELKQIRLDELGVKAALRMSVGISSGSFDFFLVGESHRELIIAGPEASQVVQMESLAEAGEILLSPSTFVAISDRDLGPAKGTGRLLKREPQLFSLDNPVTDIADADVDLVQAIPAAIRERLFSGVVEPEHKRVTVAFIHFDGTDELLSTSGPADVADKIGRLVSDVQRAADGHGVCFLGSDVDKDGGKIILTGGAPSSSESDEENVLLALREVMDVHRGLSIRVGVNSGPVFAGEIGPTYRRTYTVMGDTVNVAARIMAKAAPGQILTTANVLDRSKMIFETTPLEPFFVKGKKDQIHALAVGRSLGARGEEEEQRTPIFGRESEQELLHESLERARSGRGQLVQIIGEAGIGKSRLVEELRRSARVERKLSAQCELYDASTPYRPLRRPLRAAVGIADGSSNQEAADRLRWVLDRHAPELIPWASLIGMAVDVEIAPSEAARHLTDEFRKSKLEEAWVSLLHRVVPDHVLFSIEDAHWMDESSADLLKQIIAAYSERPWLICVTTRNVNQGFAPSGLDGSSAIHLRPLDEAATRGLLESLSEDAPIAPHDTEALVARSGGNPLFIRELVSAKRAGGEILDELPESIEASVAARIDSLPPQQRSLLRRLSVLGPAFEPSLALSVFADELPNDGSDPWMALRDFLVPGDDGKIRFRHALIRDAAYERLPYRLRRTLHSDVGEQIQRLHGSGPEQSGVLSMHFLNATRYEQAWHFSCMAAQHAREIYANVEAARFYERALEAARHQTGCSPEEVGHVHEELGDVWMRIGEYRKASIAYRGARRFAAADELSTARLLVKQGKIHQQSGRYDETLRWLRKASQTLQGSAGAAAGRQRAHVAAAYVSLNKDRGNARQVIAWSKRAIGEAEGSGAKDVLAHAYNLLDWAYVSLGSLDEATFSSRALTLYEELGDLWGQGVVLNNLGAQAYWRGMWNEAVSLYDRGRDAWEQIGDAVNAAIGTINAGEVLSDQGRLDEAEILFKRALRVWRAADYRSGVGAATSNLGRAAYRAGRFDEGLELLAAAREEFERIGAAGDVFETDARIADALILRGDAERSLATARGLLEKQSLDGTGGPLVPMLLRVEGWALRLLGDVDAARGAFDQSLQEARDRDALYEIALTLGAICALKASPGEESEEMERERAAILQKLGVVQLFVPPTPSGHEETATAAEIAGEIP